MSTKKKVKKVTRKVAKRRVIRATKTIDSPKNPYGGKLYSKTFEIGSRKFWDKDELIREVSKVTGFNRNSVKFAFDVLRRKNHQSNGCKSNGEVDASGKIKIVDCRRLVGGPKPVTRQVVAKKVEKPVKKTVKKTTPKAIVTPAPVVTPVPTETPVQVLVPTPTPTE